MTRLRAFALGVFFGWRACQFVIYWLLRAAQRRELADRIRTFGRLQRELAGMLEK